MDDTSSFGITGDIEHGDDDIYPLTADIHRSQIALRTLEYPTYTTSNGKNIGHDISSRLGE